MKGIVFKEFIQLVEDKFGEEMAETLITESQLESGGAYTSGGTYDHNEILSLVTLLGKKSGAEVPDLVKTFAHHLAKVFASSHPDFFAKDNAFEFLKSVDDYIHIEVKKLYPDAETPSISFEDRGPDSMTLHYKSKRPFADLAEGLIEATIDYFKEDIEITTNQAENPSGTSRTFYLKRKAA